MKQHNAREQDNKKQPLSLLRNERVKHLFTFKLLSIMAIINSMAIGKARKSAGNITFATIKGRTVAREKPAYVRNPQTLAQMAQRAKMAKVVAVWRAFANRLTKVFTVIPGYGSAYNQFVKMNIDKSAGITVDPMTGKVTVPAGLSLGNGKYADNAVLLTEPYANEVGAKLNDQQLKDELKIGDIIGLVVRNNATDTTRVSEIVVLEATLPDWRSGADISFGDDIDAGNLYALYYFSPSRNISSSPVLKLK